MLDQLWGIPKPLRYPGGKSQWKCAQLLRAQQKLLLVTATKMNLCKWTWQAHVSRCFHCFVESWAEKANLFEWQILQFLRVLGKTTRPEIWSQCGRGDYSAIANNMSISLRIPRSWLLLAVLVMYTASFHAVNNGHAARAGLLFQPCFCFFRGHFTQFRRKLTEKIESTIFMRSNRTPKQSLDPVQSLKTCL